MQKFEKRDPIEFTNEGEKIFGILHRPLKEELAPAVLFCHGLAGSKVGKHRMYVLLSEALSKEGVASFRFDYRGSGDSEGDFSEMSLEGEVSDTLKAFDVLCSQPGIDTHRIAVFGRSFGGSVSVIASRYFGRVKSIALWAPVYNAKQWEEQWKMFETHQIDKKTRQDLMRINGQIPSVEFYKELFAMNLEHDLSALENVPMLIIHGESDPLVNIQHSERFIKKRQKASAETQFIRLPHSDHDFTHPEEKEHAIDTTSRWFANTLLNSDNQVIYERDKNFGRLLSH